LLSGVLRVQFVYALMDESLLLDGLQLLVGRNKPKLALRQRNKVRYLGIRSVKTALFQNISDGIEDAIHESELIEDEVQSVSLSLQGAVDALTSVKVNRKVVINANEYAATGEQGRRERLRNRIHELEQIVDEISGPGLTVKRIAEIDSPNRFESDKVTDLDEFTVSEELLLNTYNLRGVQYGNYVTQKEREHALKVLFLSLGDVATQLGVPNEAIGIPVNGHALGIAIGARGRGGSAAAHYEPDSHIINLTRNSGGGSLGHEYTHALDRYLGAKEGALCASSDIKTSVVSKWLDRLKLGDETQKNLSYPSHQTRCDLSSRCCAIKAGYKALPY
jgi:hypothetical protein